MGLSELTTDWLVNSKVRLDLSWDLEPPLARPTEISDGAHWASPLVCRGAVNSLASSPPNTPSALLHVCVHGTRKLARTSGNLPPTCLQFFEDFFLKKRFIWNAWTSKRDAKSANTKGETRTSRSAPNFGCPAANFWNTA